MNDPQRDPADDLIRVESLGGGTGSGGMTIRFLVGDCRETLPALDAGSVQAVITSPPYYSLRDYATPPLVWGGDEHAHEWDSLHGFCACGAWRGSLGWEPAPEAYIEHLVECFRHVRRVLRDDGTCWVNLGVTYAGSGKGPTGSTGIRWKPKDLINIPFMVAEGLREDGWYLRSMIPWLKRNSLPESVTDRPSTAVEYVFLLSKRERYYWDAAAVRMPNNDPTRVNFKPGQRQYAVSDRSGRELRNHGLGFGKSADASGRNRRNSDWFFESWQGLLLDEQDKQPLALVVNSTGTKEAHFACFPPKLVEPMVKVSTRPGDVVLDPFSGAGTVLLCADRLNRNAIGIDLKESYSEMAFDRVRNDGPLFFDGVMSGVETGMGQPARNLTHGN